MLYRTLWMHTLLDDRLHWIGTYREGEPGPDQSINGKALDGLASFHLQTWGGPENLIGVGLVPARPEGV